MTALLSPIDDEQMRIRRLQLPSVAPAAPLQPVAPVLPGLQPVSSIAPAAAKTVAALSSRPILEKPRHYMYSLLDLQREIEEVDKKYTEAFQTDVRSDLDHLQALNKQKIEKLREAAQEIKTRNSWGALQQVAQYVSSGISIGVGAACVITGAGAVAGACLIASGGLGLLNRLAVDSGATKWVVSHFVASSAWQAKITRGIDIGFTTVSVGLSLSIGAFHTGALALLSHKTAIALNQLSVGLNATSTFGKAWVDRRVLDCKAKLAQLGAQTTLAHNDIQTETSQICKTIECSEKINSVIKHLIDSSIA